MGGGRRVAGVEHAGARAWGGAMGVRASSRAKCGGRRPMVIDINRWIGSLTDKQQMTYMSERGLGA